MELSAQEKKAESEEATSDSTPQAKAPATDDDEADRTLTEASVTAALVRADETKDEEVEDVKTSKEAEDKKEKEAVTSQTNLNNNCTTAQLNPVVCLSPLKIDPIMTPCYIGSITVETHDKLQVPASKVAFISPSSCASDSDTFAGISPNSCTEHNGGPSNPSSPGKMSQASSSSSGTSRSGSWGGLKKCLDDLRIERVCEMQTAHVRRLTRVTDDNDYCLEFKWNDDSPCPLIGQYRSQHLDCLYFHSLSCYILTLVISYNHCLQNFPKSM